jgi:GNAT superfamily N-acetyltransferase
VAREADLEIGWVDRPTAGLLTGLLRDAIPGERPYPASELEAELTHHRAWEDALLALATEGADVVGAALLRLDRSGSNAHIAWLEQLVVSAEHRQAGIGSQLLELVLRTVRADGRTVVIHAAPRDLDVATAFAERRGATRGLVDVQNRLVVADLDRSMLEGWVERAAERAAGYSLVAFDGPCPDELAERFARLVQVMDTAPRTDVWGDTTVTPEMVRESQEAFRLRGGTGWTVCARHDATGELAGYSELGFLPHRPWLGHQGDTGVQPAHRDRGLGRWLKATNALRLLDERPDVEVVETWNADVNAPMLSINTAMGFRPAAAWQEWELTLR